jgi:hypothetical protein
MEGDFHIYGGCLLLFLYDNTRVNNRSLFTLLLLRKVDLVMTRIILSKLKWAWRWP